MLFYQLSGSWKLLRQGGLSRTRPCVDIDDTGFQTRLVFLVYNMSGTGKAQLKEMKAQFSGETVGHKAITGTDDRYPNSTTAGMNSAQAGVRMCLGRSRGKVKAGSRREGAGGPRGLGRQALVTCLPAHGPAPGLSRSIPRRAHPGPGRGHGGGEWAEMPLGKEEGLGRPRPRPTTLPQIQCAHED